MEKSVSRPGGRGASASPQASRDYREPQGLVASLRDGGWLLGAILGLGAILRFYHLGAQSLWLDEALTAFYVDRPISELLETTLWTANPPAFYLVEWMTVQLADDSELWLRFPSAVFSTASIVVAYLLATTLLGRGAALLTAFFVAISPFEINYAQEARSYALLYLVVALSYLFFFRYLREGDRGSLLLWVLASSSLVYVHYLGPLAVVAQNVLLVCDAQGRRRWKEWLGAQVIVVLAVLPLVRYLTYQTADQAETLWIPAFDDPLYLLAKTVAMVTGLLIFERNSIELVALGLGLVLPFVASTPGGRPRLRVRREALTLLAMVLLPFLLLVAHNMARYPLLTPATIRYIGHVGLPLWMLLALGLQLRGRAVRAVLVAAFAATLAFNHLVPYYQRHAKLNGKDWRGLVVRLCDQASSEDVVVTTRLSQVPFWYYGDCFEGRTAYESVDVGDVETIFYIFGSRAFEATEPPEQIPGYRLAEKVGGWFGFHRFERDPATEP